MHFDATITFGNLLTILAILVSVFGLWHKLEIRLTRHDMILENIVTWKSEFNGVTKESFDELKTLVKVLENRIHNLEMRGNK